MSLVMDCPQCGRKLAMKEEFAGRKMRCPHCQEAFQAPAEEDENLIPLSSDAPSGSNGSAPSPTGVFLDELHSAGPSGPGGFPPPSPSSRARSLGSRPGIRTAKAKGQIPKEWLIGGGILGGAILLGLLLLVVFGVGGRSGKGAPAKESIKWGKKESERKEIFMKLVAAVDDYGYERGACDKPWNSICNEHKIDASIREKILDEGFNSGWELPPLKATADTVRGHRMGWIASRGQLHRSP